MTSSIRSSGARRGGAGQTGLVMSAALVAALFAAVGLFHTGSRIAVVQSGFKLAQVEARHRELIRENEQLKMERATLRSASRLEAIAHAKLNMVRPSATQLVRIAPERPGAKRTEVAALDPQSP